MHLLESVHSSKKGKLLASIACVDLLGSVRLDQLGCASNEGNCFRFAHPAEAMWRLWHMLFCGLHSCFHVAFIVEVWLRVFVGCRLCSRPFE